MKGHGTGVEIKLFDSGMSVSFLGWKKQSLSPKFCRAHKRHQTTGFQGLTPSSEAKFFDSAQNEFLVVSTFLFSSSVFNKTRVDSLETYT
jgi:hypothetical protein